MIKDRLTDLYERSLTRPEVAPKQLPLEKLLERPLEFYPEKPKEQGFDIVEIGPGTGDFLMHIAEENPDKKIVAVELGNKRFEKISERLHHFAIKNVTLIHGDARVAFYKYFEKNQFEKCFVLFPDPGPKNKHRHLRLLSQEFLKAIAPTLKKGAEFTLGTDVKDYATWSQANLEATGLFSEYA